jgi:hypothetical protein
VGILQMDKTVASGAEVLSRARSLCVGVPALFYVLARMFQKSLSYVCRFSMS